MDLNWIALTVFVLLFGFITWLGFAAAHWRRGDLELLHEWGLGGRRFGTLITWFLLGGDIYTAYTFIAVPALAFGAGALAFFAVPYTIIIYPLLFIVFPRLWHVCHKHGYVTAADFVSGRFGNRWLALAITITGIVATMPYIALQLVGLQVVIGAMGVTGEGFAGDIPLIIAFVILAAFTYSSGLRAPAAIAIVKDLLIYVTAFYPHTMTAILSATSGHTVRRNAALLPAYTFVLGLLALLGFFALADGVDKLPEFAEGFRQFKNNFAVPALFLHNFPSWFAGVAFAAIGIGALVPAAIMSIAAANLFTRNVYREFFHARATDKQESQMAKWVSLVVKFGALVFIVFVPLQYAIQLQLLGGIWIIQTLPAVMIGLYTRWFNSWALLIGWAAGTVAGTYMAVAVNFQAAYPLAIGSWTFPGYTALYTLILNLGIAIVLTPVLNMLSAKPTDQTVAADYYA